MLPNHKKKYYFTKHDWNQITQRMEMENVGIANRENFYSQVTTLNTVCGKEARAQRVR